MVFERYCHPFNLHEVQWRRNMDIILFLITLFLTFLTARRVQNSFYNLFYTFLKNQRFASYMTWILFLPGVFIHEASHYILALLLGVRTGKFVLLPQIVENRIILGHVEIGKTDFLRRFLVGIAPLLVGLFLLYLLFQYGPKLDDSSTIVQFLLFAFLTFEIVNTMFLSKEDVKGSWKVFVPLIFFLALFSYWNIEEIPTLFLSTNKTIQFQTGTLFLLPALFLNIVVIIITRIARRI